MYREVEAKLTHIENTLHLRAVIDGPVCCCDGDLRTARRLQKKGYGHIASNPGANYSGPRTDPTRPYGGYYVANCWVFNQQTKSFEKID